MCNNIYVLNTLNEILPLIEIDEMKNLHNLQRKGHFTVSNNLKTNSSKIKLLSYRITNEEKKNIIHYERLYLIKGFQTNQNHSVHTINDPEWSHFTTFSSGKLNG